MLTATERELTRMAFRIGLFQRRGVSEAEAEVLADRLLERDRERDDRRLCLECAELQPHANRDGTDGCFAVALDIKRKQDGKQRLMPEVVSGPRFFSPLRNVLQRCAAFTRQKP